MGVYIRALHYITLFESERRERRVGVTVLDIMSWDGKTGHRVGFIRITLTSNICFGRDLLHLKADILSFLYIYVSCIWGEYSRRFRLFYLRVCEERWQRQSPGRERTLFILLILEKHIISLLLWLYRNKTRPFADSNDTLFLSVRSKLTRVFLVLFAVIKKIRDMTPR